MFVCSIHNCFETIYLLPISSFITRNKSGEITGTRGIGASGYYRKKYYNPIKYDDWNTFWHWGIWPFPWYGVGIEYVSNNGSKYGVSSLYIMPILSGGKYYNKSFYNKWHIDVGGSPPFFNSGINQANIKIRYKK